MATIKKRKPAAKTKMKKKSKMRLFLPFLLMMTGIMVLISLYTSSAGVVGVWLKTFFGGLFNGNAAYVAVLMILTGVLETLDKDKEALSLRVLLGFVVIGSIGYGISAGLPQNFEFETFSEHYRLGASGEAPGVVNLMIYSMAVKYLGLYGSLFLTFILLLFMASIVFDRSVMVVLKIIFVRIKLILAVVYKGLIRFFTKEEPSRKDRRRKNEKTAVGEPLKMPAEGAGNLREQIEMPVKHSPIPVIDYAKEYESRRESNRLKKIGDESDKSAGISADKNGEVNSLEINAVVAGKGQHIAYAKYRLPGTELLNIVPAGGKDLDRKAILKKAKDLERTLNDFGVDAKVIQISRGPTITRYEIQPKPGVKVSRIVALSDDIALNLAAKNVRIEAPIPGKAAVGIEVPNEGNMVVSMRELIESEIFQKDNSGLTFALGKDISGNPVLADLTEMPHLLIAGATGSGKSVCVNALITSLLFGKKPDEVKFLMIDPKVVELNQYNGIPHLIMPVVTDPQKSAAALNWVVNEMNERYKIFADSNVRDIKSYNGSRENERMYQIVVIIDELSDLMMVAPNQVEDAICRIAQMARAAGIHLIVATQRPSVDVITGIIKANIPSRIAFSVSSQADSRTILDMGGAEKLLGKGDMLYYPVGQSKPKRIQGVFVSDEETKRILDYIKVQTGEVAYQEIPADSFIKGPSNETDELLPEVIETIAGMDQISISMLQRKFRMGYNRAARIIDELEIRGVVSKSDGKKPRNVLINEGDLESNHDQ